MRCRNPENGLPLNIRSSALLLTMGTALIFTGCTTGTSEVFNHGYVVSQDTLDTVPVGSSREQVLLGLGTPSTEADPTVPGGLSPAYYYISQKKRRSVGFAKAKLIEQRVLAVYFGEDDTVSRIANYGLQDGKVFDFISRTTPTGGKDAGFLGQILGAAGNVVNPFGG